MANEAPRDRKRHRSRSHILAAARELILEKGAEALSLREVAARAGYSPASLYEYFDGKDDLVATLVAESHARLNARMRALPTALPPPRRLIRLGQAYLAFARENPEDFALFFGRTPSKRQAAADPVTGSAYEVLRDAVVAGLEDGTMRPEAGGDAEEIAYGFWALAHGLATLQLTHLRGFQADFEAADLRALETYVAGLMPR